MRFAPQYFDTVVLIEGVVAQYGFHVEFLQKLIAGYAELKYGLKDDDRPEQTASADVFGRLREAGKDTLLLVAHDSTMPSNQIETSAAEHGLAVTHLNWLDLTKPMRAI
ncbi:hypothetical protein Q4555_14385 [Octadecabacter sp. 1_MG-2023]|uniref:hypothetical protein n=1 Tax=unclassified Octadecabacter TaxID=196158 RepID=UPI001C089621|nr:MULTISPECIES: hypothetical protein [unclassified Octadecabacter]MBU2991889.1 hypothetical protein [Octadecabacter sp. B2R22]MDO6735863.1 hypothetical protein [Octadecabacter sp. 1_MG-2023]